MSRCYQALVTKGHSEVTDTKALQYEAESWTKLLKSQSHRTEQREINWEPKMLTQWLANAKDLSWTPGSAN